MRLYNSVPIRLWLCWLSLFLMWSAPLLALDTLKVGAKTTLNWQKIRETASFLSLRPDSIWVWDTAPNTNLVTGIIARSNGGLWNRSLPAGGAKEDLKERSGLAAWVDGDPATAWGPDEGNDLTRQVAIYLDLGATFRVNRIRFFPRQDREHVGLILGSFGIATNPGSGVAENMAAVNYDTIFGFSPTFPNRQSIVDRSFPSREVRYILLVSQEIESWELAELEVYADGTLPTGEFVSTPLFVRGGFPIWGRVLVNGRDAAEVPILIQTRTGPDPEPVHYFVQYGDDLVKVSFDNYLAWDPTVNFLALLAPTVKLGPTLSNPAWSPWQTVTDGLVTSPSPQRYMQFRVLLSEPGTILRELSFEYVRQPLAGALKAEISPSEVEPGEETLFTLSLEAEFNKGRGDTGVRYLQVLTPAMVSQVERVLVDDQEVVYSAFYQPGEGFTIDLWHHLLQSGSFVQVLFLATVLRDGTLFQVRAMDLRHEEAGTETVYQNAGEEDVDPLSPGGNLVVRLRRAATSLVDTVKPLTSVFTPNGDGVNDFFEVSYNLLKLLRPAPVSFAIFDLQGRRVRQGYAGVDLAGQYRRIWDGRDEQRKIVAPGVYLYRIQVQADAGESSRQGVVQVVY